MAKKRTGNNTQPAYKLEGRYAKNKRIKLERHLKKFPDDVQAKKALDNVKQYSRKKPFNNNIWKSGSKAYAEQLRKLGYNGMSALKK